ncbi:MAG TPA: putative toxin-antitoxin system toxin component, PIN family [Spirochaetota bacterium]|nr:putative toxin-antitoxin system toxin component, PIN family [Spirochaetota bacterium]HPV43588.1 putative toxin-antitoxin system toxin component, PIN family [Spirochaetota bacterium]
MSDQNAIKIVVDTNLWISFLIGKRLSTLKDSILKGRVEVYLSDELYQEIIKVLEYPRIKKYITLNEFFELINLFGGKIHFIKPDCVIKDCRDSRDNFLLELAVTAHADYLVTGDADLLELNPYQGLKIIKAQELENVLKTRG